MEHEVIVNKNVNLQKLSELLQCEMRIADKYIRFLELVGVKYIFGLPASNNAPLFDSLVDSKIKVIVPKNEAGSTYSASHYAGASCNIGVCLLGGTVGINNAINGIGDAYVNKHPMLIISGSPPLVRRNKGAIQNVDTVGITKPITKYSHLVSDKDTALIELSHALSIAMTPPYGPVHVAIPVDIQTAVAGTKEPLISYIPAPQYNKEVLQSAAELIGQHENGIIFAGRGAKRFSKQLKELSLKLGWPIISTPCGKGICEDEFELFMGNYGMFASDFTKSFIEEYKASCLLVLGSSLNEITMPSYDDKLMKNKKIIHIDYDEKELNKIFEVDIPVHCDLEFAMPYLIEKTRAKSLKYFRKTKFNHANESNNYSLSLRHFVENIPDLFPPKTNIVSDIGEFMTYIFKYMPVRKHMHIDIYSTYGAMGNASGGAIGTHLALPDYQTVVITGDGGFFMNGMELLTAKINNFPIVYIVVNNAMLGLVNNGLKALFGRGMDELVHERVDISAVAQSMGIPSMTLYLDEDISKVKHILDDLNGPYVVELVTDNSEISPMMERMISLKKAFEPDKDTVEV